MIYILLAEGFEEIEALTPADILRRCGLDVMLISAGAAQAVKGSRGITVLCDAMISDINEDFEAIILPGGGLGTVNLESNTNVRKLVELCIEKGKKLGAICAAPTILAHMGILEGKRAVCYPSMKNELISRCSEIPDSGVCVDGNIITATGVGSAMDFAFTLAHICADAEKTNQVRRDVGLL